LSWLGLERKFRANVRGRLEPDAINRLVDAIKKLDNQLNLTAISNQLLG
jgi:formate hydrogenlyase subunit 4